MKTIATLRYFAENKQQITPETLEDLGFVNVLAGRYKLVEDIPNRNDDYKSTIYVDFMETEGIAEGTTEIVANRIEACNIYGNAAFGNAYIGLIVNYNDMLAIVEMLKI